MNELNKLTEEIQNGISFQQISNLLDKGEYIPFTDSSLSFSSLVNILNDISINRRRNIVEFGSGTSTLIIGKLLQKCGDDGQLLSIEHNQDWADYMMQLVKDWHLEEIVTVAHIPLLDSDLCKDGNKWYQLDSVLRNVKNLRSVDCVLVDGPPAYEKGKELARYPALPALLDCLAVNCAVFLDDTWREGERKIVELWSENEEFKVEKFSDSFTGFFRGDFFNVRIPKAKF